MRLRSERVLDLDWANEQLPKIVRIRRRRYKGISRTLDDNRRLMPLVHKDLATLSSANPRGRKAGSTSDSDADCFVDFAPDADWTLLDVIRAEQELSQLLGRPVDLVEKPVVEQSENWIRRRRILRSARTIHAG